VAGGSCVCDEAGRGEGTESQGSGRLRQALIVGEVALTLTLSVAAILLMRQLVAQSQQDLGFSPENLVVLDTRMESATAPLLTKLTGDGPPSAKVMAEIQKAGAVDVQALNSMLDGIRAVRVWPMRMPSTEYDDAVGFKRGVRGAWVSTFTPGVTLPNANIGAMTPGYLQTMEIPVLKGRGITRQMSGLGKSAADQRVDGAAELCGNGPDRQADHVWLGFRGRVVDDVGVVGDVRQDSPGTPPGPTIYTPVAQHVLAAQNMQVVVRTRADAGAMTETLRRMMKRGIRR